MTHAPDWTDEEYAIAAGMKRAGLSCKAIGQRLGVSTAVAAKRTRGKGAYTNLTHGPGPNHKIGTVGKRYEPDLFS